MENKIKKKTTEEKVAERQMNNLLNFIIAKTFARHSKMTEEEYLKDIGFENSGLNEEEAIRMATMNVIIATMNELLMTKNTIKNINALLKTYLIDDKITESDVKGE